MPVLCVGPSSTFLEDPLAEDLLRGTFAGKDTITVKSAGEKDDKKLIFDATSGAPPELVAPAGSSTAIATGLRLEVLAAPPSSRDPTEERFTSVLFCRVAAKRRFSDSNRLRALHVVSPPPVSPVPRCRSAPAVRKLMRLRVGKVGPLHPLHIRFAQHQRRKRDRCHSACTSGV